MLVYVVPVAFLSSVWPDCNLVWNFMCENETSRVQSLNLAQQEREKSEENLSEVKTDVVSHHRPNLFVSLL